MEYSLKEYQSTTQQLINDHLNTYQNQTSMHTLNSAA